MQIAIWRHGSRADARCGIASQSGAVRAGPLAAAFARIDGEVCVAPGEVCVAPAMTVDVGSSAPAQGAL